MTQHTPQIDERYRIERELGSGGYGRVYVATEIASGDIFGNDTATGDTPIDLRRVALKVLDTERIEMRRFRSEVRALCLLNHPNIVRVFNFGGEPTPWVAMELVEGQLLSEIPLPTTPVEVLHALKHLIAIADALAHAHSKGVVHRDLKPQNVLVDLDGIVRVVDFGLSWLVKPDELASQRIGTPGYLAPELIEGDPVRCDHRADLYSFGSTTHALFCGRSPFVGTSLLAIIRAQLEGNTSIDARLPPFLRPLVERCLHPDPAERPPSAASVADELRRIARTLGTCTATWTPLDEERVDVRDATLTGVEPFSHATRGDGVRVWLVGGRHSWDAEHREQIGAFAYSGAPNSPSAFLSATAASLADGTEVSVYGARRIRREGADDVLALDGDSVMVVEPYFPVSATSVARTDGVRAPPCGTRELVDMRDDRAPTAPIVTGSLLHAMLESLVHFAVDPRAEDAFDTLFERALSGLRVDALAAGLDDDALGDVRENLRSHFPWLARWTSPTEATRRGRVAEAARYSSRFGLEGRIDLLVSDAQTLRVVELKTGRHESAEHETQLRCYALMLDELARNTRQQVEAWLLYSATGKTRKLQRRGPASERLALHARNDVVAMHRWFSGTHHTPPPGWGEHPARCADAPCRYRGRSCRAQSELLGNQSGVDDGGTAIAPGSWVGVDPALVVATRRYYFHFVRMIEREYAAASAQLGAMLRESAITERIASFNAIGGATVVACDASRRSITFQCSHGGIVGLGDSMIAHRGEIDAGVTFHGTVRELGAGTIVLETRGAESVAEQPADGWTLERDTIRSGFRDMHRALYAFVAQNDAARLELLVRPTAVAMPDTAAVQLQTSYAASLNAQQQLAIRAAIAAPAQLLIHGPPGTGKTAVIAAIVGELVARGQRVLLAAFTNTAVDTMLARVLEAGATNVIRIGSSSRATPELLAVLEERGLDAARYFSVDAGRAADSQLQLRAVFENAQVVACTANGAVSSPVLDLYRTLSDGPRAFDVAILDEASQLVEPLALGVLRHAERVILVGDERQLPPVIQAPENVSTLAKPAHQSLLQSGVGGLDRSLFERLRPYAACVMLTTQYRMHPNVQDFPSRCFYGGHLVAAPEAAARRFPLLDSVALDTELARRLDPERPSVWVEASGEPLGNLHAGEVFEVVRTAAAALRSVPASRRNRELVGILSPYRAQCQAIRAALREELGHEANLVEVDTVERFQGREKEAILISLVAHDWNDFVMDPRRLNVMLTRARTKVVVFGRRALGRRMIEVFAREA
jgi:DNA replication ATP-dependent helicase Dna2